MAKTKSAPQLTEVEVCMFRMGTGDCLVVKLLAGKKTTFTMMIDCGTQRKWKEVSNYMQDLIDYTAGHVDVLVVTHEHDDHVNLFHYYKEFLRDKLKVDQVWLAWSENESDKTVDEWRQLQSRMRMALALARDEVSKVAEDALRKEAINPMFFSGPQRQIENNFSERLHGLAITETGTERRAGPEFKAAAAGMKAVKELWVRPETTRYLEPGNILGPAEVPLAGGVKFYVLGPPRAWTYVGSTSTKKGEVFEKNPKPIANNALTDALLSMNDSEVDALPFDPVYLHEDQAAANSYYRQADSYWRNIDMDWLQSAGNLALRLDHGTNNLSLVLALELPDDNGVLLFPGDAEYKSWQSWHHHEWPEEIATRDGKPLVEWLLNNTVVYKIAHHISSNGTAQRLGLDMMPADRGLVAFGTFDHEHIEKGWLSTMPNNGITNQLLRLTQGRMLVIDPETAIFEREGPTGKQKVSIAQAVEDCLDRMAPEDKAAYLNNLEITEYRMKYTLKLKQKPKPKSSSGKAGTQPTP